MSWIINTSNRIQRAIAVHGIMGVLRIGMAESVRTAIRFVTFKPSLRDDVKKLDQEFDRKWGVDTSGIQIPQRSEVIGKNWVYGINYQGCNSTCLDQVLKEIKIKHEQFTFIDLGSGKGRGILIASLYPFKKIIGVDYSEQLNDIARKNILRFPSDSKRCHDLEVVLCDAAKFAIPDSPLVIFLYCPFGRQVMQQVLDNILKSYQRHPREIIVVYLNPLFGEIWKQSGFLKEVLSSKNLSVYRTFTNDQSSLDKPQSDIEMQ